LPVEKPRLAVSVQRAFAVSDDVTIAHVARCALGPEGHPPSSDTTGFFVLRGVIPPDVNGLHGDGPVLYWSDSDLAERICDDCAECLAKAEHSLLKFNLNRPSP
jgi:hypothetical protein